MNAIAKHTRTAEPPPHILVMEDDQSVARGLEMVLTEAGYVVDLAGTGELALEAFRQKRFDLLVADLRLPDADGMDIVRQVRANKPQTEVIVITGYGTPSLAVDAMKIGVQDFLPKPFTEDQIKAAVNDALKETVARPAAEKVEPAQTKKEKLIQKRQVVEVLNRTTEDGDFWSNLMANGSEALDGYHLSGEAKAALAGGDLKWINANVGELTQKQLMFIYKRLEREAW